MPLPDSFIQDLLGHNDIEAVVSSYVRLKRTGQNLVGLCPFHGEKTPSFTVFPSTASFYCFGCGAAGDVITFIKRIENLDYLDAVKFLADRAGMKMPDNQVNDAASRMRMRILEANREAARFYHHYLYSPEGRKGLEYYYSRGYTDKTIRHFGLGYASEGWDTLLRFLRQKGFKDEELTAAFLAKRSSRGSMFDIFHHRVIVPIIDIRGNVIGFGGRILDDSKPKYINTSDTLVFKKTNNLFGLNFAKSTGKKLILCEGYMDVIALHQAGFTNAVAALGTSFTADHARLLSRYADEVTLIFDSDAAGQKGAQRAIGLIRETGVDIRVIAVPNGKDPDEFIRTNGAERFKLLLDRAANDVEYRLMQIGLKYDLGSADGKAGYLREAAELLAGLSNSIERDVYAGKLSKEFSVSKEAILSQIRYLVSRRQKQQKSRQLSQIVRHSEEAVKRVNPEAEKHPRAVSAEEAILGTLLLHPDRILPISQEIPADLFVTPFNRELYVRLIERQTKGLLVELAFLAADYDEEKMAYITRMVHEAQGRNGSMEELRSYGKVLRTEQYFRTLNDPAALPADQIRDILEELRKQKT